MCKNNLEADLEQDPLIVVSPIAVGKSSNASFDAPDPGAAEATKSQDRRRIILFSVLTVYHGWLVPGGLHADKISVW